MQIAHYDYHIFFVNRSLSFIALVYATLAYEMVLFQVRQERWRWTEGDYFEKQFDKLIHKSRKSLQFAFPKKDDNLKIFNIRFKDILTSKLNFQVMLDSLKKIDFTDIEIVCCFNKKTILDVIVEYATATAPVSSLEIDQRVCDVLYNNLNLMQLSTEVRHLIASGLIRNWSIFDRSLTRFEKFAMIEMSNSVDTFEEWKEILANADKASEEISDAIDEWLDKISHFKK